MSLRTGVKREKRHWCLLAQARKCMCMHLLDRDTGVVVLVRVVPTNQKSLYGLQQSMHASSHPGRRQRVTLTDLLQLWAHARSMTLHRPLPARQSPPSSLAVHVSAPACKDHYIFQQVTHKIVMEKSRKPHHVCYCGFEIPFIYDYFSKHCFIITNQTSNLNFRNL